MTDDLPGPDATFPVPHVDDDRPHVYVSVGHQQMMTDAMAPLGISVWQMTALRPMYTAGGRLFVDVAEELSSPARRDALIAALGRSDPLIGDALRSVVDEGDLLPPPDHSPDGGATAGGQAPAGAPPTDADLIPADPALVTELIEYHRSGVVAAEAATSGHSGEALFDAIEADVADLRASLVDPRSHQALMAAFGASHWLDEHVEAWLGEPGVSGTLSRSVPHNVASEMGLALLDVADAVRPHPEVVAYLRGAGEDDDLLADLARLPGGPEAADAIAAFLAAYGVRCEGEIDITRPRWRERPFTLVPLILAEVDHRRPGEGPARLDAGRRAAEAKAEEILTRVRALPDGEARAEQAAAMIARLRTFTGYREHPKFAIVSRYWVYRQGLLAEAARLVAAGVLDRVEDASFLTFGELRQASATGTANRALIARRREEHRRHRALRAPRVLTSTGAAYGGRYRRHDVPPGALAGLGVSPGVVEGPARVIVDLAAADPRPGDVLVTTHTDPAWSPLLAAVAGLVTEVGGLATHGAVVAREYGLPAVVGVEDATRSIPDGRRIRVDGTRGLVTLLPAAGDR